MHLIILTILMIIIDDQFFLSFFISYYIGNRENKTIKERAGADGRD